ncbi:sorting nexin-25-like, partial [Paramuricea clavata]
SGDRKDSTAEPLYNLTGEVFELKGVFKWLRRTLIAFVQVTFGRTINREIRELVEWVVSEPMIVYYIQSFCDVMWPQGKLAPAAPVRTDAEKIKTRRKVKEKLLEMSPEVLQNLVGKRNCKLGIIKMFEAFQDIRTNKHLAYLIFELCIFTIFPEIRAETSQDLTSADTVKNSDDDVS